MAGVGFVSEKKFVGRIWRVRSVARFGSSLVRRYLNEFAPPSQLHRWRAYTLFEKQNQREAWVKATPARLCDSK
jgi:hypothetical protein